MPCVGFDKYYYAIHVKKIEFHIDSFDDGTIWVQTIVSIEIAKITALIIIIIIVELYSIQQHVLHKITHPLNYSEHTTTFIICAEPAIYLYHCTTQLIVQLGIEYSNRTVKAACAFRVML